MKNFVVFLSLIFSDLIFSYEKSLDSSLEPKGFCDFKIDYQYFNVCYSIDHRQAFYTSHWLRRDSIKGPAKRKNDYRGDFSIENPVRKYDYKRSGFDRGHLVPAADMKLNAKAMSDTFYMTNMSPQLPQLNRSRWAQLENYIRNRVLELGPALIITAPVLANDLESLDSGVSIPRQYYKIAFFPDKRIMEAYLFENSKTPLPENKVTVDFLEALTGYDFFPGLEDNLESVLESQL